MSIRRWRRSQSHRFGLALACLVLVLCGFAPATNGAEPATAGPAGPPGVAMALPLAAIPIEKVAPQAADEAVYAAGLSFPFPQREVRLLSDTPAELGQKAFNRRRRR